ncbi:MAG: hypothetical protein HQL32_11935 [Planctomycetes bacterium]|nr:hypothetical protein [Planctomycetota bacterium]
MDLADKNYKDNACFRILIPESFTVEQEYGKCNFLWASPKGSKSLTLLAGEIAFFFAGSNS